MSRRQLNDSDLLRQQALFAGCWQDAHQGVTLPVTDPATGETLATIPALGRAVCGNGAHQLGQNG